MFAIIYFLMIMFNDRLNKLFNRCFPNWVIGDCDPNEEIGTYWASLDENDLMWSLKEEEQFRSLFMKEYNVEFKMLLDDSY